MGFFIAESFGINKLFQSGALIWFGAVCRTNSLSYYQNLWDVPYVLSGTYVDVVLDIYLDEGKYARS